MIVGIEVEAEATVKSSAPAGLRILAEACKDRFAFGVVLYDSDDLVPFGQKLAAAPLSSLWSLSAMGQPTRPSRRRSGSLIEPALGWTSLSRAALARAKLCAPVHRGDPGSLGEGRSPATSVLELDDPLYGRPPMHPNLGSCRRIGHTRMFPLPLTPCPTPVAIHAPRSQDEHLLPAGWGSMIPAPQQHPHPSCPPSCHPADHRRSRESIVE